MPTRVSKSYTYRVSKKKAPVKGKLVGSLTGVLFGTPGTYVPNQISNVAYTPIYVGNRFFPNK